MKLVQLLKKKAARRSLYVLGAVALFFIVSGWYVHLPYPTQVRNYDRFGILLAPVENAGEWLTQWTDVLGITGMDASAMIGDFKDEPDDLFFAGRPEVEDVRILENEGYFVGYSEDTRNPAWVAYRLFEVHDLNSPKRPSRFTIDERTKAEVKHDDYTRSGYDRGHMAPNYGIATRFGKDGQKETFMMSNIVPQRPNLNRRVWRELEWKIARFYGQHCEEVWIVTGPIYEGEAKELESGVRIPDAFFKIAVDLRGGEIRVMPFIFLQESEGDEWMRRHLVSVDSIEALTQIDFFPELPDELEDHLEAQAPTRLWRPSFAQLLDQLTD